MTPTSHLEHTAALTARHARWLAALAACTPPRQPATDTYATAHDDTEEQPCT